jgi:hypothetical protein
MKKTRKEKRERAMHIPGFTAAASLYGTSRQYNTVMTRSVSTQDLVLPQFFWCGRVYCCDENGNCGRKINLGGEGGGIATFM